MNDDAGEDSNQKSQAWSARGYSTHARFVSDLGAPVLALLAPQTGERILDLGCGDGVLTKRLVDEFDVDVVGVDSALDLIRAARGLGLDVHLVDAHALEFSAEFDAVFSNAALHWMQDPDKVLAGVVKALKPGGRFVGEFGGFGNVAAIMVALLAVLEREGYRENLLMPWYFPTPEEYQSKLEQFGFIVNEIALVPRPTRLPTHMHGWLQTFAGPFLSAAPEQERGRLLDEAVRLLTPVLCDSEGHWTVDYVRLRFAATRGHSG